MNRMRYVREVFSSPSFPVFSVKDVFLALKHRGVSKGYVNLMMHNLVAKKEVTKVTRGMYTFHNDSVVAGFAFKPFYYGLDNALALRGISGQGANFVVITSRNVVQGVRAFQGRNYRVHRIRKQLMFGYDLVQYGHFWIPVSDLEKTVIDMLYFRLDIEDELWGEIAKRLDASRVMAYLKKYPVRFRARASTFLYDIGVKHAVKTGGRKSRVRA